MKSFSKCGVKIVRLTFQNLETIINHNKAMLVNQIRLHKSFFSHHLSNERDVVVYLPYGYGFDTSYRYPVLYMQDGQNLFDGRTSFMPDVTWRADEIAQELIHRGEIEPLIIVGIYNSGFGRINEYTHTANYRGQGGKADDYGRMLIEEIKPFIDSTYRTHTGREHTAIGGSSLGGLLSLYLGLRRPDVFSRLAVMSPSIWWDGGAIFREVERLKWKLPTRIWLDIGTREGVRIKYQVRRLRDALKNKGWKLRSDLYYMEARRSLHNEISWSARFDRVLKFLFGRR